MPTTQTISTTVTGPIDSNGGAITVTGSGTIDGSPTGVDALSFLDHHAVEQRIDTVADLATSRPGRAAPEC